MAYTEVYVDPSIAGSSGAGTVGDPYGDLQYALDSETHDATNGTRFNIKSGTDEVLAAALDFTTYGTSTFTVAAPLVFQGYTSAAGDGGVGGISGAGSYSVIDNAAMDYVKFISMHLHNFGAAIYGVRGDNGIEFWGCELNNGTGTHLINADNTAIVVGCYLHDFAGVGLFANNGFVKDNLWEDGATNKFTTVIDISSYTGQEVSGNVMDLNSTGVIGIDINSASVLTAGFVDSNSIYNAAAGTGKGIYIEGNPIMFTVRNNLVEGFSGTGGVGIDIDGKVIVFAGNGGYNNTTNFDPASPALGSNIDNEALGASPFTDAANGDFEAVDTGNVLGGAWPTSLPGV